MPKILILHIFISKSNFQFAAMSYTLTARLQRQTIYCPFKSITVIYADVYVYMYIRLSIHFYIYVCILYTHTHIYIYISLSLRNETIIPKTVSLLRSNIEKKNPMFICKMIPDNNDKCQ